MIRFAAIGLSHNHIYNQVDYLLAAGATLVAFHGDEPERVAEFGTRYPQAPYTEIAQILDDETIQLVVSASSGDAAWQRLLLYQTRIRHP
jgi:predicted dehydrogenase